MADDTDPGPDYDGHDMPPGRPRKGPKLATPADYPHLSFRLPQADSERLERLIAKVWPLLEKRRPPGDPPITRGRVLARAVVRGLEVLADELAKK